MTDFNVTIHPSAHYYQNYTIAFFLRNFKHVRVHQWDQITPETYIYCIVAYSASKDDLAKHVKPHTKIVFISGEPFPMDLTTSHLGLHCIRQVPGPTESPCVYTPFYMVSFAERFAHPKQLLLPPNYDPVAIVKQKEKFCAYMYSNPVEHRDTFFDAMTRYKSPDALGSCRNPNKTKPDQTSRYLYNMSVKTYYEDAIEQYKPYKFVIAIENSKIPGYITEKLMNPVLARAVPIYLGPPDLFDDGAFNRKAMIHIGDFPSYDACVEHVKKVDQDPDLYLQYLREPIFIGNKLPKYFDTDYLLPAFLKLFQV